MWKSVCAALIALSLAAPAAAAAEADDKELRVTNEARNVVYCVVLVDGKARNYLNIRPGRTYASNFDPRRSVQLVCERAKRNVYGPLKLETDYTFVQGSRKVDLVESAAAQP